MLYTLSLVFSLGLNATASTSFNHSLVNRDIQLNANGVGSITSMYYNYELGKGANDSQIVSSKVNGLYSLVVKRENNSIVSTTESIKQSENLYNTKHTIYGDKKTFFITNCRGQKGKVFNDVICSSINEEV
ncbi:MAG: hypothetical protein KDD37_03480, partial [Bdellovibrionales bacterium]|nr:hypothetical protein [Bdellovibrionales bacterium]